MICEVNLRVIYRSNVEIRTFSGMIVVMHRGPENLNAITDEMSLRPVPMPGYVEIVYVDPEDSNLLWRCAWYHGPTRLT